MWSVILWESLLRPLLGIFDEQERLTFIVYGKATLFGVKLVD